MNENYCIDGVYVVYKVKRKVVDDRYRRSAKGIMSLMICWYVFETGENVIVDDITI